MVRLAMKAGMGAAFFDVFSSILSEYETVAIISSNLKYWRFDNV